MKKSKSFVYLKNILESENVLDKTAEIIQHYPCVPFYSEMQKMIAEKKLQKNREDQIAVTHLADSHGVGLRHAAVNAHRDKLKKKKAAVGQNSKSGDLSDSVSDPNSSMIAKELDTCMAFGKPSFPDWLEKLPPEWTVIQITEVWEGSKRLNMLGYGPPPSVQSLPKLLLARFSGRHPGNVLSNILENPIGEVRCSLLAELNSILEGNRLVNKEFRGNRDQYWRLKQEHHDQLKVLVDSLENWWLDYRKCLLIGDLVEPSDTKLLKRITASSSDLLKKVLKRSLTECEEMWVELLISSYGFMNQTQLVRGITKTFNTSTSKSPVVTELIAHLKTVQNDLDHLKVAKRNPVILVLDKMIQQLPWESMAILNTTPTSRIPSLHFLRSLTIKHGLDQGQSTKQQSKAPSPSTDLKLSAKQVDPKLTYYIVNPGQDLPGVQQRLQPILEEFWGKHHGISGAVPVEQQIKQCLKERDLFLYCGHGSGSKYIPNDQLIKVDCRAAPILMGCSSGQLSANGRVVDPTGAAAVYLMAGSPGLIGMLWEVTDIDCDRFTVRLLDFLLGARKSSCNKSPTKSEMRSLQNGGGKSGKGSDLPSPPAKREPEILRAVALSRPITKNFLTGAAAVVYGLPLRALNFNEVL